MTWALDTNWVAYFKDKLQLLETIGNRHCEFLFDANDLKSLISALEQGNDEQ